MRYKIITICLISFIFGILSSKTTLAILPPFLLNYFFQCGNILLIIGFLLLGILMSLTIPISTGAFVICNGTIDYIGKNLIVITNVNKIDNESNINIKIPSTLHIKYDENNIKILNNKQKAIGFVNFNNDQQITIIQNKNNDKFLPYEVGKRIKFSAIIYGQNGKLIKIYDIYNGRNILQKKFRRFN